MTQATLGQKDTAFRDSSAEELGEEYIYRSVSRAAVLSATFGVMGLLAWMSPLLLFLPAMGLVFGIVAFRNLKRYSNELSGTLIAWLGVVVSSVLLVVASTRHTYIYYTEVPEGFERVAFATLMTPTGTDDIPTASAIELNGKKVFLKGYIHPSSISSNSSKSFVLVPDFGTCCFGGQPRLTHMIEVRLVNDKFASKSLRLHSLAGTFEVHPLKPVEGLQGVFYEMNAEHFE